MPYHYTVVRSTHVVVDDPMPANMLLAIAAGLDASRYEIICTRSDGNGRDVENRVAWQSAPSTPGWMRFAGPLEWVADGRSDGKVLRTPNTEPLEPQTGR